MIHDAVCERQDVLCKARFVDSGLRVAVPLFVCSATLTTSARTL